jgi:putative FmdB family regulatory protein
MPIYRYICEKCGSQMEVMQKVSDAPLKRCKKCRGKLGKVVSRTSFKLKGSGWYATDYSSKPASVKAKAEGSIDGKSDAAKPAKNDSAGVSSGD